MSLKNKLFNEMNSTFAIVPTQPNPNHGSTEPMDNCEKTESQMAYVFTEIKNPEFRGLRGCSSAPSEQPVIREEWI